MWLVDALLSGFTSPTPEILMQIVQLGAGIAALVKALVAFRGDGWNRLTEGRLERTELESTNSRAVSSLILELYRPALVIRVVGALMLTIGILAPLACVVLILCFAMGYAYERRYNTIYICLILAAVALMGRPYHFLHFTEHSSAANTWPQFLVALLVINLYWNSAWQKMRSAQFSSGLLLQQNWQFLTAYSRDHSVREYIPAAVVTRSLPALSEVRLWRQAARGTILIEWVLPMGLLVPSTFYVAVLVGVLMHAGFTLLMPYRLLSFSIVSISGYAVFWPGQQ